MADSTVGVLDGLRSRHAPWSCCFTGPWTHRYFLLEYEPGDYGERLQLRWQVAHTLLDYLSLSRIPKILR